MEIQARRFHTAVWTGSEMIVWGGYYASYPYRLNTGGRYDPATDNWRTRRGIVVGVAEDFHFESVHNTIQPVCFFVDKFWINWMSIKIGSADVQGTIAFWNRSLIS